MFKQQKEKNTSTTLEQNVQIPEVYANAAFTNISPYEIEITLGLGSNNYQGVKPIVNIRMSPQFAKEFCELLVSNVKMYEESYGEIKIPIKAN